MTVNLDRDVVTYTINNNNPVNAFRNFAALAKTVQSEDGRNYWTEMARIAFLAR